MCRLYALHANEPTRVECSLVRSQNNLMLQSERDREGLVHGHGWGVADYSDGLPLVEKQTWAAYHGEHFTRKAAKVYARNVIAHVRRATVGPATIENTHPFQHGTWIFAHNGTVPNFDKVRLPMLEAMDPLHRSEIRGSTDSEHIFRYLLSLEMLHPGADLLEVVRAGLSQIIDWSREVDPAKVVGLNIVMTDGNRLVGSRINRTLWHLTRTNVFICPICGESHVHHKVGKDYRAVEIASETITEERNWIEFPNNCVFIVQPDYTLRLKPLEAEDVLSGDGGYITPR